MRYYLHASRSQTSAPRDASSKIQTYTHPLTQSIHYHHKTKQSLTSNISSAGRKRAVLYRSHPSQQGSQQRQNHPTIKKESYGVSRPRHLPSFDYYPHTPSLFPSYQARPSTPQARFPESCLPKLHNSKIKIELQISLIPIPHIDTFARQHNKMTPKRRHRDIPPSLHLPLATSEIRKSQEVRQQKGDRPQNVDYIQEVRKKQRASSTRRREIIREEKVEPEIPVAKESPDTHLPHIPPHFFCSVSTPLIVFSESIIPRSSPSRRLLTPR
ncbi:hypothetical protein BDP55DRAFT_48909 [Colletotrichum godetiae]|uniref:Uncharacterized protein n=1 Tax=Colletotrichum godetiae TaxID=1209918 RepID=A0AAJ0ATB8_9PEZI|nr:uncharacterized protein BDP55DRAFT_48909 [Colletotrichum godetiae]KAK1688576.1 hypothetical protein BDP55DRAFT_48909 [Colletotrichum godetiae]